MYYVNGYTALIFRLKIMELDDTEVKVSFVRDRGGYYTFPLVKDVSWFGRGQVIRILDLPTINSRGHIYF